MSQNELYESIAMKTGEDIDFESYGFELDMLYTSDPKEQKRLRRLRTWQHHRRDMRLSKLADKLT